MVCKSDRERKGVKDREGDAYTYNNEWKMALRPPDCGICRVLLLHNVHLI